MTIEYSVIEKAKALLETGTKKVDIEIVRQLLEENEKTQKQVGYWLNKCVDKDTKEKECWYCTHRLRQLREVSTTQRLKKGLKELSQAIWSILTFQPIRRQFQVHIVSELEQKERQVKYLQNELQRKKGFEQAIQIRNGNQKEELRRLYIQKELMKRIIKEKEND